MKLRKASAKSSDGTQRNETVRKTVPHKLGIRQKESLVNKAIPEFIVKPAHSLDFVDKPIVQARPRCSLAGEVLPYNK
jgi:hypothetical protein